MDREPYQLHEHIRLRGGRVRWDAGTIVVRDGWNALDITLSDDPSTALEVVTPVGRGWTWTRLKATRASGGGAGATPGWRTVGSPPGA